MNPEDRVAVSPEGLGPAPGQRSWVPVAVVLVGGAIALVAALWAWERHQLGRVSVEQAWLTAGREGDRVDRVSTGAGDVYFHGRLIDVPLGEALEMECEWIDPSGLTARHNRYRTRTVERDPWTTRCKHSFGSDAARGSWRVHMTLAGRSLVETYFEVE